MKYMSFSEFFQRQGDWCGFRHYVDTMYFQDLNVDVHCRFLVKLSHVWFSG